MSDSETWYRIQRDKEWREEQQREADRRANDRFDAYDAHRRRTEQQRDRRG